MIINGWTVLKAKAADDSQRLKKNHERANWTLNGRTAQENYERISLNDCRKFRTTTDKNKDCHRIFIEDRFETANVRVVCQL